MTNTTKTESPSTSAAGAASRAPAGSPGGAGMERKWLMLKRLTVAPAVSGGTPKAMPMAVGTTVAVEGTTLRENGAPHDPTRRDVILAFCHLSPRLERRPTAPKATRYAAATPGGAALLEQVAPDPPHTAEKFRGIRG